MSKVAYDLHGTIDVEPDRFKALFEKLRKDGNEVWIISGPPTEQVIGELHDLGFEKGKHYDEAVGVVSYLLGLGLEPTKVEDGNYWFEHKAWWSSKAQICAENEIILLVDNETKYAEHFLFYPVGFTLFRKLANGQILFFELEQFPNTDAEA